MKSTLFRIGILCGLALAGCNENKDAGAGAAGSTPTAGRVADTFCDSPNEQDLEKTARCYHLGIPGDAWHFLSKESQAEEGNREKFNTNFEEFNKSLGQPVAFKVLGVETRNSQTFGRIELVQNVESGAGKPCKVTGTASWIQEGTAWRRLRLPKTMELNAQQFANGDYSAALSTAERWLSMDPFSIDAYRALVFAISRGGQSSLNTRTLPDTVRAILAVNPADSMALTTAVSFTMDSDVSESLFDRFSADDCARENAAFNRAQGLPPKRALEFLEKLGSSDTPIEMEIIKLATVLGDKKRLETLLTDERDKQIRSHLDGADSGYAAGWAVSMGEAWLALNRKETAKAWASYAATRDPNEPEVANLLRKVRS